MLLFNSRCNHYKYSNNTGNLVCAVLTAYGYFQLYLNRLVSLCIIETACCSDIHTMIICSDVILTNI